jgi:hypothetical protein
MLEKGIIVRDNVTCVRVFLHGERWLAVMPHGQVVPVTNWFDDEGDDCEHTDAITCVAGCDEIGWMTIELTRDEPLQ